MVKEPASQTEATLGWMLCCCTHTAEHTHAHTLWEVDDESFLAPRTDGPTTKAWPCSTRPARPTTPATARNLDMGTADYGKLDECCVKPARLSLLLCPWLFCGRGLRACIVEGFQRFRRRFMTQIQTQNPKSAKCKMQQFSPRSVSSPQGPEPTGRAKQVRGVSRDVTGAASLRERLHKNENWLGSFPAAFSSRSEEWAPRCRESRFV